MREKNGNKNSFLFGAMLLLISSLGLVSCKNEEPASLNRPNLIVIYTDDQRQDALGAWNNQVIRTPHLDRMASQAVKFRQAHVVFSLCSPSRAALLTGRYGSANGVLHLGSGLNPDERTVAQDLQQAGYLTAMMGKWHLKQKPEEVGFEESSYFLSNGTYNGRKIFQGDTVLTPSEHCDAYCVDQSIAFLQRAAQQDDPFFLLHCTQLPHMNGKLIWDAKAETKNLYQRENMPVASSRFDDLEGKPDYLKQVRNRTKSLDYGYPDSIAIQQHTLDYYSVITEMDAFLGKLFQTIDELGLRKNTYIVFMSDNGWMLGEHGFTSKVLPYAPSSQVPMFILGPDLGDREEDGIVLNIDIAPTLLAWAGIEIPSRMHGSSLLPLLTHSETVWREAYVYEGLGNYGGALPNLTAFDTKYRYILTYSDPSLSQVEYEELYDQEADPEEMQNLAYEDSVASIRHELRQHIFSHRARILGLEENKLK